MSRFWRNVKVVWGVAKGSSILTIKSLPRLFLSPYVGAVRGVLEEMKRNDAEHAAFLASYIKSLERADDR
jgi:hypothetical protein